MSVLLVEDNDFEASLFERAVAGLSRNLKVLRAKCLREAETCLCSDCSDPIEAVFVDQHLPDGLGTDLAGRIKHSPQGCRSAVFMLTCDVSDRTRAEALASDTDGFLTKPVPADRLREILEGRKCHWNLSDLPRDLDVYRRRMRLGLN